MLSPEVKRVLFVVFCFFSSGVFAQSDSCIVTISITTASLSQNVYIVGNDIQLGSWNPGKIALNKKKPNLWERQFRFPKGRIIEFKFTQGTWATEAVDSFGNVGRNNTFEVMCDTSISFHITNWKDEFDSEPEFVGQITGHVEFIPILKSKNIRERKVFVWLPPEYDSNPLQRYPVLYMHDGQNLVDPSTSIFGIDWQIDETADSLVRNNIIQPFILVGIYNTPDRSAEYLQSDTSQAYMKYLVEELKPFIDNNYRTLPDRNNTAVAGSSAGGLISFMLAWEYENIFSKVACLSPALKVEGTNRKIDYVAEVRKDKGNKKRVTIYFDNGTVGLEKKLQPGIDEMISALQIKRFELDNDLFFYKDIDATHSEMAWSKKVNRFLKLFFGRDK